MRPKIRIAILYQVIMHYRVPFYERIANDEKYDMTLLYGKGKKGTKLINADISETKIKGKNLFSIRLPFKTNNGQGTMLLSPCLLFTLIFSSPQAIFSEGSSSLLNASIAFVYSKIFRKKFIWWSLGSLTTTNYKGIRKFINKWEHIIEKKSDAIFTYSTQGKEYFLSRGINEKNIFVAVNVIDTNKKLEEIEKYQNQKIDFDFEKYFNLVFIGSITKEKNLELLIDTLDEFNRRNKKDGFLHIIGDGPYLTTIEKYIQNRELRDSICLYGRINEGANRILKYCDVMVLPGLGGLAICEAMLNSLPIITGIADGTEVDLIDNSNGFILPDISNKSLLSKIEYLYNNPEVKLSMGKSSYEKITTTYSFNNYYNVFNKCIKFVTDNESTDNNI